MGEPIRKKKKIVGTEIRNDAWPIFKNSEMDASQLNFRQKQYSKKAFEATFFDPKDSDLNE